MTRLSLLLLIGLLAAPPAHAAELKVATWNLNWLTSRGGDLPDDVHVRQPEDFDRLRAYALRLNADLIALQEVDNAPTARRVFPAETWSIHMTRDHVRQRVGFAIRRGLDYDINADVTDIALDPAEHLRSGADITLHLLTGRLRVLAVHLKTGCWYASLTRAPRPVCQILMAQFDAVDRWIAARRDEGGPFLVLGDFNRDMDKRDRMAAQIQVIAPMTRATEGLSSPCWGHAAFIDHILIGGAARAWIEPNSLRVLTYEETSMDWKERLSDHCPVSIKLMVPD